uniref:Uncharacterized protein n=1 Tax=Oryza barthii TaxID=65489 RepID=A0A0D3FUT5_9ORYZ
MATSPDMSQTTQSLCLQIGSGFRRLLRSSRGLFSSSREIGQGRRGQVDRGLLVAPALAPGSNSGAAPVIGVHDDLRSLINRNGSIATFCDGEVTGCCSSAATESGHYIHVRY